MSGPPRRSGRWTRWAASASRRCCSAAAPAAPILANPPAEHARAIADVPDASAHASDPQPDRLPARRRSPSTGSPSGGTTPGHLASDDGRRFGFEFVVFRAERGAFPVSWASHLALTDEQGQRFLYGQRSEIGPQVDASPHGADGSPTGFDLAVDRRRSVARRRQPPAIRGRWAAAAARDRLAAALSPADVASPAASPDCSGSRWISRRTRRPSSTTRSAGSTSVAAGGSYYYSRPRMAADGTLSARRPDVPVTGEAWFDHQWGDFISVGARRLGLVRRSTSRTGRTSHCRSSATRRARIRSCTGRLSGPTAPFAHLDPQDFDRHGAWAMDEFSARRRSTLPAGAFGSPAGRST